MALNKKDSPCNSDKNQKHQRDDAQKNNFHQNISRNVFAKLCINSSQIYDLQDHCEKFLSADFQALILVRNKLRILGRRLYHIESFPEEQNGNSLELRTKKL